MSLNDKKTLDQAHRQGQIDGAKNEYHSQVPGVAEALLSTNAKMARKLEEEEVYRKGWDNGYKTR